jgi:hypothetical protein
LPVYSFEFRYYQHTHIDSTYCLHLVDLNRIDFARTTFLLSRSLHKSWITPQPLLISSILSTTISKLYLYHFSIHQLITTIVNSDGMFTFGNSNISYPHNAFLMLFTSHVARLFHVHFFINFIVLFFVFSPQFLTFYASYH